MTKTGRCLCGAVCFAYDEPRNWCVHCHCESCRRQTSSPFTTFVGVADGRWRWTGAEPRLFQSSPGVRRYFCPTCGAPVAYGSDRHVGELHFYASLLDDQTGLAPEGHVHWEERVPWVEPADDLPRREG